MRATARVLHRIDSELDFVHKQRRRALLCAVEALIAGGALWLSALGRTLVRPVAARHRIKAMDRLLGNAALHQHRQSIYGALAGLLLRGRREAVVLVDVTEIRPGVCAMTASLAMDGRSVPIYDQVRHKKTVTKRSSIAAFLKALERVLPRTVTPILVTDAGFESPWFDQVAAMGWHYVGRVRHQTKFLLDDEWVDAKALHRLATSWARCLGKLAFPKHRPAKRRLVLSVRPRLKGRTRKNARGRKGRAYNDRRCSKSAREPWLLATSLDYSNPLIVSIYALRMQIEQNYRDTKNHRWGWRLDQNRSRSNERIEMLLLIAAIAMVVVFAFGCVAERHALHKRYQANTLYSRRVLSFFTLGQFVLRDAFAELTTSAAQLIAEIRGRIYCLPAFR